ncbi:TPA: citrate (Si)-synthase [Neisseria meningitidis]
MPSEPAGRLFQKMPYRCNFMRLYGVGFAFQTAYASRSSLVFQSVHDYINNLGADKPLFI